MTAPPVPLQPGDVLAVRTGGLAGALIRFGAALRGQPNLENHIAILHHYKDGIPWCIEGRPGGVGWRDGRAYLASRQTETNELQPKTPEQRALICQAAEVAIGTGYDWSAIAADAAVALRLPVLWQERWDGQVPGHVVCSSLAAWAYSRGGLAYPSAHDMPHTTPADWTQFIIERGWVPLP